MRKSSSRSGLWRRRPKPAAGSQQNGAPLREGAPQAEKRRIKAMATKATFYHAGCPVCADAETAFAKALDPNVFDVEIVHLGEDKARLGEAEAAGVKSVPAFVIDGRAYHINFGADLSALK
jgi:glutaredoxin